MTEILCLTGESQSRSRRFSSWNRLALLLLLWIVFPTSIAEAQRSGRGFQKDRVSAEVKHAFRSITGRECLEHVTWLADDLREGRLAGSRGSRDSADYIKSIFKQNGLLPGGEEGGWFQNFVIPGRSGFHGPLEAANRVRFFVSENALNETTLEFGTEFLPHPRSLNGDFSAECAYFYEPLQTPDQLERDPVKGNIVVLPVVEPLSAETLDATCADIVKRGGVALFLVENSLPQESAEVWPPAEAQDLLPIPVVRLRGKGVEKLWQISGRPAISWERQSRNDGALRMGRPFVRLEVSREGRDLSQGRNVVGRLLGSDSVLRDEYVIIGAHYDHVGRGKVPGLSRGGQGEIHNGADDNASGVSAMLEIAEAYALNRLRPKRTLIFVAFDAEEMGLHGSNVFVAESGYPIESMVGMINLDMIARNEPRVVKVVRRSSDEDLGRIIQKMAKVLDLTPDETGMESFINRSDQAAFLRAGIPSVFFFGGLHDDYHTSSDEIEDVNPAKMENVGRLAFLTAWDLLQQTSEPDGSSPDSN
ncbi:MAG: M20/M25/M40 family metallo-hydrolase [Planctomycetota bacterium]